MLLHSNIALRTTLQLPCTAQQFYAIQTVDDISAVTDRLKHLINAGKSFKLLGGGSNVLCASSTIETVLQVQISGITLLGIESDAFIVQAGAGELWHDVVLYTLAQGWAGLENLALIPGCVGAAPVQNIGAYGVELCERLHSVQAWDLQLNMMVNIAAADCGFAYRDSLFKHHDELTPRYIITHVTFKLARSWQPVMHYGELAQHVSKLKNTPTPQAIAEAVIAIRRRKLPDPTIIANAGSFFKNPIVSHEHARALKTLHPNLPVYPQTKMTEIADRTNMSKLAAGWLIEAAGWKGFIRNGEHGGQVGVHTAQALVLVHLGGATGADMLKLANDIQTSVLKHFGVILEREVNVW